MKVLLVVLHADRSRGGAEGYTVTLFHRLLAAGHDARVAAATFEASIPRDRRVPLSFSGVTRLGRYGRFLRTLEAYRRANPDTLVHAMLPVRSCDVYQPQAGLEIVEWRRTSLAQRLTNGRRRAFVAVEKKLLTAARPPLTICLSDATQKDATRIFGRPERFVTVYHAVDDDRFPPAAPRAAAAVPVCVFVGQDFRRKGLDVAIAAVARHPAARLRVVGGDDAGPYRALIRSLAATRDDTAAFADRFEFTGATRDVATQLADADAFVFPTRREPFGMVGVEAMLCGVPPVVSANAGFAEIVRDGTDGRVVHGEDPADWAAALGDVLANREAMSRACLARRETLCYSHHLRTLTGLYERLAADRRD